MSRRTIRSIYLLTAFQFLKSSLIPFSPNPALLPVPQVGELPGFWFGWARKSSTIGSTAELLTVLPLPLGRLALSLSQSAAASLGRLALSQWHLLSVGAIGLFVRICPTPCLPGPGVALHRNCSPLPLLLTSAALAGTLQARFAPSKKGSHAAPVERDWDC